MAHQGRPGVDSYYMVLHVRKIHWTEDGWLIVSPERYAGVEQSTISDTDLSGSYEQIVLSYNVVPGYENEQIALDFQTSISLEPATVENRTKTGVFCSVSVKIPALEYFSMLS